jgi:hypothetical protein
VEVIEEEFPIKVSDVEEVVCVLASQLTPNLWKNLRGLL